MLNSNWRYTAPPQRISIPNTGEPAGLYRRHDLRRGPYGAFINHIKENVSAADNETYYMALWKDAEEDLHYILWGKEDDRIQAASSLQAVNKRISAKKINQKLLQLNTKLSHPI